VTAVSIRDLVSVGDDRRSSLLADRERDRDRPACDLSETRRRLEPVAAGRQAAGVQAHTVAAGDIPVAEAADPPAAYVLSHAWRLRSTPVSRLVVAWAALVAASAVLMYPFIPVF
jgi:hypothetical protein